MIVAILADTHVKRTGKRRLPEALYRRLGAAGAILHAGDVVVPEVLDDLARFAPVHAVRGNNDHELAGLPEKLELELDGVRVGMIHDSGPAVGRTPRLRRIFPDAQLVVFGHSHIPLVERDGPRRVLINPGSPTDKRRQPNFTMALAELREGRVLRPRLVVIEPV